MEACVGGRGGTAPPRRPRVGLADGAVVGQSGDEVIYCIVKGILIPSAERIQLCAVRWGAWLATLF